MFQWGNYSCPRTRNKQNGVGKNVKDKQRDKRGRDGDPSQEVSLKREKFPNTRKVCGDPWNLRGRHNREEK